VLLQQPQLVSFALAQLLAAGQVGKPVKMLSMWHVAGKKKPAKSVA
jgi:hypothetical protein